MEGATEWTLARQFDTGKVLIQLVARWFAKRTSMANDVRGSGLAGGGVVITGASTGIGKKCALYLDQRGYRVFAGVRKASDGEVLTRVASSRLSPLILT